MVYLYFGFTSYIIACGCRSALTKVWTVCVEGITLFSTGNIFLHLLPIFLSVMPVIHHCSARATRDHVVDVAETSGD